MSTTWVTERWNYNNMKAIHAEDAATSAFGTFASDRVNYQNLEIRVKITLHNFWRPLQLKPLERNLLWLTNRTLRSFHVHNFYHRKWFDLQIWQVKFVSHTDTSIQALSVNKWMKPDRGDFWGSSLNPKFLSLNSVSFAKLT